MTNLSAHDPTSEPSRAVHWLCIEANIPIDIKYTWLTRGEHLSKAFLAVNPLHQIPAQCSTTTFAFPKQRQS